MKKIVTFTICLLAVISVMAVSPEKMGKKFVFNVYGGIPVAETTFEATHFLGGELTGKWNTFTKNYTRIYEVSVGLSGSTVEILKPTVYNAVQKVNKYYKKALKSDKVNREEAVKLLAHILDCANVICTEHDTGAFEQAVADARTPEEIITLFLNVELKFM